jgi:sugar O-acyltransferase (sialic acid O-acetyltransferase NeuD family)
MSSLIFGAADSGLPSPSPNRHWVLLGAGGHAKVLMALVQSWEPAPRQGLAVGWAGVCDPALASQANAPWQGLHLLGGDEALQNLVPQQTFLVNGVGQQIGSLARQLLFTRCREAGFEFPALVHGKAWVASDCIVAAGVQIMAGAVVQPGTEIGFNSVINTGATLDHDNWIGPHVHIAPGATLCGGVRVAEGAFIGAGATLLPGCQVGRYAVVAAGATVHQSVPDRALWPRAAGAKTRPTHPTGHGD